MDTDAGGVAAADAGRNGQKDGGRLMAADADGEATAGAKRRKGASAKLISHSLLGSTGHQPVVMCFTKQPDGKLHDSHYFVRKPHLSRLETAVYSDAERLVQLTLEKHKSRWFRTLSFPLQGRRRPRSSGCARSWRRQLRAL